MYFQPELEEVIGFDASAIKFPEPSPPNSSPLLSFVVKNLKLPGFTGLAAKFDDLDFVKKITNSKAYSMAVTSLNGIKTGIANVIAPMKNAFGAIFGTGGGGGPAGSGGGKSVLNF